MLSRSVSLSETVPGLSTSLPSITSETLATHDTGHDKRHDTRHYTGYETRHDSRYDRGTRGEVNVTQVPLEISVGCYLKSGFCHPIVPYSTTGVLKYYIDTNIYCGRRDLLPCVCKMSRLARDGTSRTRLSAADGTRKKKKKKKLLGRPREGLVTIPG